jgi:hypothetical protein
VTFQEEKGESGTPHLQVVGSFKNARTFKCMKKKFPKAHIEKCNNLEKSIKYCSKLDTRDGIQFSSHVSIVKDPLDGKELYDWQKEIIDILSKDPDNRKIYWYWSKDGNKGKTSFIKSYLLKNRSKATFVGGSAKDMIYAITQVLEEYPLVNTVFVNIPRCIDIISYNGLEQIKDGLVFNMKYESGLAVFNPPHIVVMANQEPFKEKMSEDRWVIKEIK